MTDLPGSVKPDRGLHEHDDRDPFAARARQPWQVAAVAAVLVIVAVLGVEWAALRSLPGRTPGAAVAVRHRTVAVVLDDMSHAMRLGDEAGWLADVEPSAAPALRQLYVNLRNLRVTDFTLQSDEVVAEHAKVRVGYCLVGTRCLKADGSPDAASVTVTMHFTVDGSGDTRITGLDDQTVTDRPVPWLTGPLVVAAGRRVVVAAPPEYAGRVPDVVGVADQAAGVADTFATPPTRPARYLIYLAGSREWQRWSGGGTVGSAVSTSDSMIDIAVRMDRIRPDELRLVIQHEMGHVVTQLRPRGVTRPRARSELIAEGIAEYIAFAGQPVSRYRLMNDVRTFLDSHRWDGYLSSTMSANVGQGLGFLSVHCLVTGYGESRMRRFVDDLLRGGLDDDRAAVDALGEPWPTVNAKTVACVAGTAKR